MIENMKKTNESTSVNFPINRRNKNTMFQNHKIKDKYKLNSLYMRYSSFGFYENYLKNQNSFQKSQKNPNNKLVNIIIQPVYKVILSVYEAIMINIEIIQQYTSFPLGSCVINTSKSSIEQRKGTKYWCMKNNIKYFDSVDSLLNSVNHELKSSIPFDTVMTSNGLPILDFNNIYLFGEKLIIMRKRNLNT